MMQIFREGENSKREKNRRENSRYWRVVLCAVVRADGRGLRCEPSGLSLGLTECSQDGNELSVESQVTWLWRGQRDRAVVEQFCGSWCVTRGW